MIYTIFWNFLHFVELNSKNLRFLISIVCITFTRLFLHPRKSVFMLALIKKKKLAFAGITK
ncbi:hypothetical protein C1H87_08695 [Flavivirga eckloniae]|uniref:Uncharacterized protein n=1 Tax=Flavivirga eckloniae TaxID=1803846 RepID=A0A2K9PNZ6_9FLAO|nr:hypothetical protein C1H87_08695 [Flavivirga eckloniae]